MGLEFVVVGSTLQNIKNLIIPGAAISDRVNDWERKFALGEIFAVSFLLHHLDKKGSRFHD